MVCFQPKDQNHTVVTLEMYYEPENALEKAGDALGLLSRRVEGDLERFRHFIQERRTETGSWRGEIRGREVKRGDGLGKGGNMQSAPEYDASGKSGL